MGKVHNNLLNQTQHNDFRVSHSTECLSDNINDLEIVNFHWEEPPGFMEKTFGNLKIPRNMSLEKFHYEVSSRVGSGTTSIYYLYKRYFQRN